MFFFFHCLKSILITGKDASSFLQRLITNDLEANTELATVIATPKGKIKFFVNIEKKQGD